MTSPVAQDGQRMTLTFDFGLPEFTVTVPPVLGNYLHTTDPTPAYTALHAEQDAAGKPAA